MFKKFSTDEISSHTQAKSSIHRNIRKKVLDTYPEFGDTNNTQTDNNINTNTADDAKDDVNNTNTTSNKSIIDRLLPKKIPMYLIKAPNFVQLIVVNNTAIFFSIHDGIYLPTLRLLHEYPYLLPKWRCDKGAIKFLMNGSNVMCPGLTHPNAKLEDYIEKGKPVAIYIEGKEHAIAIGITTMSNDDVVKINKGVCVEVYHHLGDGLWMTPNIDTK